MKKVMLFLLTVSLLTACGKSKSGKQVAEEVCECYKKSNALDAADPKRAEAQAECLKIQGANWAKVKDDEKKSDEFNKVLSDCASEQIKKSFGQ
jgi:hypothetical protein